MRKWIAITSYILQENYAQYKYVDLPPSKNDEDISMELQKIIKNRRCLKYMKRIENL